MRLIGTLSLALMTAAVSLVGAPGARAGVGNLYSQYSPFGSNGTFWYGRIKIEF